jgi:hypothetical protein
MKVRIEMLIRTHLWLIKVQTIAMMKPKKFFISGDEYQ